jgi:hypothetical protein
MEFWKVCAMDINVSYEPATNTNRRICTLLLRRMNQDILKKRLLLSAKVHDVRTGEAEFFIQPYVRTQYLSWYTYDMFMLAVQSNMSRQVQSRLNILLLMIYLTILLVYQTIQIWCHNMRIFNCSRCKGEPPWPNLGNYQRNELRKLMKNLKNDSWSLDEHPHS